MAAEVILECVRGKLLGVRYAFSERATCVLGRSSECYPRISDDANHRFISRHHCLLDINPPDIRVRDFGSLNGTYVNDVKIGQRVGPRSASQDSSSPTSEYTLQHGDRLRIADSEFKVIIKTQHRCRNCGTAIQPAESGRTTAGAGQGLCPSCAESPGTQANSEPSAGVVCASCGRPVPADSTRTRGGSVLCMSCRDNPEFLVEQIAQHGAPDLGIQKTIADYRIVRCLGKGGMGVVYLVRHPASNKEMALKVLLPQIAVEPDALKMFQREIAITRRLEHPNIVKLVDAGFASGAFFLCLEYCRGGSVRDLMQARSGVLDAGEAVAIVEQILDALEYAHKLRMRTRSVTAGDRGLVHRDIKPRNILLSEPGSTRGVKLGDFGLSKAFDLTGLSGLTRTGETCGSPYFICRQQVLNYKYSKAEVDLWATAASLYNMLTGAYPRDFPKGRDMWQTVLQSDPVPIRDRQPDVPPRLAEFIDHALQDRPAIPYQTARAFRDALRAATA